MLHYIRQRTVVEMHVFYITDTVARYLSAYKNTRKFNIATLYVSVFVTFTLRIEE